ncbi:hypothetical protein EDB89DRAFT_1178121 [Lactarius sanguifluus]|nr:hypothetical protein EDB89DRAFT_1178121 [Lactarius sanguifluus]
MSDQVFSPLRMLKMRRLPSRSGRRPSPLARPPRRMAPFCHQIGRHLQPARVHGGDAVSAPALLQEELAAQLTQMAGQLRRNAGHFSGALAADLGVLRAAEAKVGANLEVMGLEWVRDHSGKTPGTTCPTISNVVVAIAFLVTFFVIRGDGRGRRPPAS